MQLTKVLTHYLNSTAPAPNEVDTQAMQLIAGTNLDPLTSTLNASCLYYIVLGAVKLLIMYLLLDC